MFGLIAAVGNQVATSNMHTTAAAFDTFDNKNKRNRRHNYHTSSERFTKKGRLQTKTGYLLSISKEGVVTGVNRPDPFAMLILVYTFITAGSDNKTVNIQGYESNKYLCMNKRGKIYAKRKYRESDCEFDVTSHQSSLLEFISRPSKLRPNHPVKAIGINRRGKLLSQPLKKESKRSIQFIFEDLGRREQISHGPVNLNMSSLPGPHTVQWTPGGMIETAKNGNETYKRVIIEDKSDISSTVDPKTTGRRRKCNSPTCKRRRKLSRKNRHKNKFIASIFDRVLKSKRRHRRSLTDFSIVSKLLSGKKRLISSDQNVLEKNNKASQSSRTRRSLSYPDSQTKRLFRF